MMRSVVSILLFVSLCACGSRDTSLMQAAANSSGNGPDEFGITINRALEDPESYASLPTPDPLGQNRAAIDPRNEAISAMGGRAVTGRGVARSSPLLSYASRFGYDPDIRETLATEDEEFRKRNRGKPVERLFSVNVYFDSYQSQSLDPAAEYSRLQELGVPSIQFSAEDRN